MSTVYPRGFADLVSWADLPIIDTDKYLRALGRSSAGTFNASYLAGKQAILEEVLKNPKNANACYYFRYKNWSFAILAWLLRH